jgi:hypothetical protein
MTQYGSTTPTAITTQTTMALKIKANSSFKTSELTSNIESNLLMLSLKHVIKTPDRRLLKKSI